MTFRGSVLQSDSDLDSIHNSSDVFYEKYYFIRHGGGGGGGGGFPPKMAFLAPINTVLSVLTSLSY